MINLDKNIYTHMKLLVVVVIETWIKYLGRRLPTATNSAVLHISASPRSAPSSMSTKAVMRNNALLFSRLWSFFSWPSVSFQVLSDLHLEINQQYQSYEVPPCADSLILAGDIGRLADYDSYRDFLQKQTQNFKLVFLILGNHEFYNGTYTFGIERARQLEQEPSFNGRLVILHQRRYDVPGSSITTLGCTLWSKIPQESRDVVQAKIKDFQKIKDWTVDHHNASHDADLTRSRKGVKNSPYWW